MKLIFFTTTFDPTQTKIYQTFLNMISSFEFRISQPKERKKRKKTFKETRSFPLNVEIFIENFQYRYAVKFVNFYVSFIQIML